MKVDKILKEINTLNENINVYEKALSDKSLLLKEYYKNPQFYSSLLIDENDELESPKDRTVEEEATLSFNILLQDYKTKKSVLEKIIKYENDKKEGLLSGQYSKIVLNYPDNEQEKIECISTNLVMSKELVDAFLINNSEEKDNPDVVSTDDITNYYIKYMDDEDILYASSETFYTIDKIRFENPDLSLYNISEFSKLRKQLFTKPAIAKPLTSETKPKGKVMMMSLGEDNYIVADNLLELAKFNNNIKFKDLSNKALNDKNAEQER